MGANVTAFAEREEADRVQQEKGGTVMDWETIDDHVHRWARE
jgi:nitrous oxide reductase accessory protein NosL